MSTMSLERKSELAALDALGALDAADAEECRRLREAGDQEWARESAAFREAALVMGLAKSQVREPRPEFKARLLKNLSGRPPSLHTQIEPTPDTSLEFHYLPSGQGEWRPLAVPGAFIKVLSLEQARGYAVVLGRLEPGTHFPAHAHAGPESLYMLTGDLHVGDRLLRPGDFHRAGPGTAHGVNWSEDGCTLIAVVSLENLAALGMK